MPKSNFKKRKRSTSHHIDFRTLAPNELVRLRRKWEIEARVFEQRLQSTFADETTSPEITTRRWETANALWRRVRVLEKFLLTSKNK